MQYKTVTLLALASAAVASPQLHKRQDNSSPTTVDQYVAIHGRNTPATSH